MRKKKDGKGTALAPDNCISQGSGSLRSERNDGAAAGLSADDAVAEIAPKTGLPGSVLAATDVEPR